MPKKVVGIVVVSVILILIGLFGIQVDHKYDSGIIEPNENNVYIERCYAPFYTVMEFDLKCEPENAEEFVAPEFAFNVISDTGLLSYDRIKADKNKLEIGESRHYKIEFSTYINKHSSKTMDIIVYDNNGNKIVDSRIHDAYNVRFIDVGFEPNGEAFKITNATFAKGGIVVHHIVKVYYIALLFLLALVVIPNLEGRIIDTLDYKKAFYKFVTLTAADLIIVLNVVIFNLFGVDKLLDYFKATHLRELMVNNKLFVEVICVLLLIWVIRDVISEYRDKTEESNLKFAMKYILQVLIHLAFVVVAIMTFFVINGIIESLFGILVGIFVMIILGLRSVGAMSTEDVVGAYILYNVWNRE